jgi:hypothetical protein
LDIAISSKLLGEDKNKVEKVKTITSPEYHTVVFITTIEVDLININAQLPNIRDKITIRIIYTTHVNSNEKFTDL